MYEPRSRTTVPLLLLIAVAALLLCPSTDASPSADISVSIVPDDEGACLVLSSYETIPSGTVIVDYTYTVSRTIGGHEVSGATSGEFEQSYVSDGSPQASIRLDFQGKASEHYDSIAGAGATFVADSGTWTAVSVPFSLPGIGETTYRFDTSSGERTVVITAADGLTATARESGGSIVVDAVLSDGIASHYGSFVWFVRDSDGDYLGRATKTVPACSWTLSDDDLGDFELGVILGRPGSGWSIDMRTVPVSVSGTVEKIVSWMYGGEGYALSISYDSSEYVRYSGRAAASYDARSDFDGVTDFVVVNDVVRRMAGDLAASYGASAGQGFAEFVLAFVQCAFSYETDDDLYGKDEYYAYPMETIQHMGGDCEDTSILCAALLQAAGYRTGLFLIPSHCIAAVALDPYTAGPVASGYSSQVAEFSYAYGGRTYYGCETTLDSNLYGVGWISDDYAIDADGEVWYTYTSIWGRTVTTKYADVWRSITYKDEGYGFRPVADAAKEMAASAEAASFTAAVGEDDDGNGLVLVYAAGAPSEDLRLVIYDGNGIERTNSSGRSIEPILAAEDFTSVGGSWLSFFDPSSFGLAVGQSDLYRIVGAVSGNVYLELPARHSVSASVEGDGDVLLRSGDALAGEEVEVLILVSEGSELKALTVDGIDRTADAVGWTGSSGSVRGDVLTLTFAMPDHDVSISAVFASGYSTDIRIAIVAEDDGAHLMMVAADDAVIPSGTITVHYSYVSEQTTPFGRQTVLLEGTVDVPYEADRAYAYLLLDLSGSGHAADIAGAYAVFTYGSDSCRSATVAFTLQEA